MSLEKRTTTRYISEYEYEATNPSGNTVKIDMYPEDEKKAQSPMDLLLSAAAACAAVDVVGMLKKKRKTVTDLTIETVGQRNETHPRYFTHIHLQFKLVSPDTSPEELAKVVHLAVNKYCSVASTLKGVAEITHESTVNSH
ncbi:MAG: OsmC family protein [Cyclobacteriaceae bacterium]